MRGKSNFYPFLFSFLLLSIACLVRSGIIIDKSFLPRVLFLTLLLLITFLAGFRKKNWFEGTPFFLAFVLFYLWNLLSCLWAISPPEAIMQAQLVFLSFAVFVIISGICRENRAFESIFIRVLILTLFFSFGLAFYKISTLTYYNPYQIYSVCANNNLYAGFLLICFPLLLTGYRLLKGFWKYLFVLAGILSVFFIIIIQSRAIYLGLFIAVMLALIILTFKYRSVFSRKNILTGAISILILLSGVVIFYSSLDTTRKNYFLSKIPVWNYFKSYENLEAEKAKKQMEAAGGDLNHMPEFDYAEDYYENVSLRYIFWKKSACLIRSHPVLGVGAGNWRLAVPSCKEPVNPGHTIKNYTYSQPHNEWIGILSELGIAGFILSLIVFFLLPATVFYRILSAGQKPGINSVFYASFIIGYYGFACFDFPFRRVEHLVVLFSILAFLYTRSRVSRPDKTAGPGKIPALLFSILFVLLLLFSLMAGSARIIGEYYTLKMFREERKNDAKVIQYCRKAGNPFYRITPNTLPLDWFEGVAQYRNGNISVAARCFEKALRSTPYEVRVLNDYGIDLYQLQKTDEGKALLLECIDIDPYFDDAKFNLAAIYYFTGERDSALFYVTRCRESQKKKDFLEELIRSGL